jgi:hypothetical protein
VLTVAEIHEKVLELEEVIKWKKAPKPPKAPRADPLIDPALLPDPQDMEESSEDEELEVMDCIVVAN